MSSLLYCSCLSFSRALGGAVGGRGVGITSIGGRFDTQLSSKDEWSALGRVVLATGRTRAIVIDLSSRGKSLPMDDHFFDLFLVPGRAVGVRGVGITAIGGHFNTQLSLLDVLSTLGWTILATGGPRVVVIDFGVGGGSLPKNHK